MISVLFFNYFSKNKVRFCTDRRVLVYMRTKNKTLWSIYSNLYNDELDLSLNNV